MIATENMTERDELAATDVEEKQQMLARARGALKSMQDISALNGNSNMSIDEINNEIAETRTTG
jgi:hypothetical protein